MLNLSSSQLRALPSNLSPAAKYKYENRVPMRARRGGPRGGHMLIPIYPTSFACIGWRIAIPTKAQKAATGFLPCTIAKAIHALAMSVRHRTGFQ